MSRLFGWLTCGDEKMEGINPKTCAELCHHRDGARVINEVHDHF